MTDTFRYNQFVMNHPVMPPKINGVRFSTQPQRVHHIETQHRRIKTELPHPESLQLLAKLNQSEPRSMWGDGPPLVWDRAEGFHVFDPWGNQWLDFGSGTFVTNCGHGRHEIMTAMRRQIDRPLVNAYLYPTEVRANLSDRLTHLVHGLDCVLFLSTGGEATECSMKLARIRGRRINAKKIAMIAFEGSFHGKTLGAAQMSGNALVKDWVENYDPDIFHVPFPFPHGVAWREADERIWNEFAFERSVDRLVETRGLVPDHVAGIIFEPYQGWSSQLAPPAFVQGMRRWADRHGAVLIADEVQSGFGRSGYLFGFEHFGITPDVICLAKAISNGVPLSAVLARRELLDVNPLINSTHAGNPLMCAAGLASVELILRERLWERAAELGEVLRPLLLAIQDRYSPWIGHVCGVGLSWCLMTRDPETGAMSNAIVPRIIERAFQKGLLLMSPSGPFVKIAPPLTIDRDALLEGLDVLADCFAEVTTESP